MNTPSVVLAILFISRVIFSPDICIRANRQNIVTDAITTGMELYLYSISVNSDITGKTYDRAFIANLNIGHTKITIIPPTKTDVFNDFNLSE